MQLAKLDIKNKLVLIFQNEINKKNKKNIKKNKKNEVKKNKCKKNRFFTSLYMRPLKYFSSGSIRFRGMFNLNFV